jgi:hypothetical protein
MLQYKVMKTLIESIGYLQSVERHQSLIYILGANLQNVERVPYLSVEEGNHRECLK